MKLKISTEFHPKSDWGICPTAKHRVFQSYKINFVVKDLVRLKFLDGLLLQLRLIYCYNSSWHDEPLKNSGLNESFLRLHIFYRRASWIVSLIWQDKKKLLFSLFPRLHVCLFVCSRLDVHGQSVCGNEKWAVSSLSGLIDLLFLPS